MNVLVFNCGSSSLKYRLIEMPAERELCAGEAQRIGPKTAEPSRILHKAGGAPETIIQPMASHGEAFARVMEILARDRTLKPDVIGHRVVHGGSVFTNHAMVTPDMLKALAPINRLAPIHNPPAVALIEAIRERSPSIPQVAVFDTSFHATIPEHARTYAIPAAVREALGARKYGFHGISHQYVIAEAARLLGVPLAELCAVSCHLGSGGASLCAFRKGRSIDNTMGFTPLQGLLMSTRSGDLDPALAIHLLVREGGADKVEALLNRRSGVLGLSGASADIRDVLKAAEGSGPAAQVNRQAAAFYLWRLRKYLGAYLAVTGRPHAVIFTDTIGELSPEVRAAVCGGLEAFGLAIDPGRNAAGGLPADVAAPDSLVRILVIATNEEISIARSVHAAMTDRTAA